jgi:HEAT repeat protein
MDAPAWWLASQIHADRYYAAHVLGELKDSRAIDVLIPLLDDEDLNYQAAWALGQIGDRRAIGPLIKVLQHRDAFVRISAIRALEALNASEALPHLRGLLNDRALSYAGDRVAVCDVAKAAIGKMETKP